MTTHPTLFDPGEATGAMTPAQTLIWQHVQDSGSQGGLTPTQAGRLIHADRGAHAEDFTCQFCRSSGKGVLENLKARKLVKRVRTKCAKQALRFVPLPSWLFKWVAR